MHEWAQVSIDRYLCWGLVSLDSRRIFLAFLHGTENTRHAISKVGCWTSSFPLTPPPPSIKSVKNFRRVPGTDSDCTERSLRDPLKHCSPEKMCLRKSLFVFYRVFISRSTLFPMSSGRSSLIKIIPLPAECHEYLLVCLEIIEHRNLCQHFVFEMCRMVVWCLEVIW